VITEATVALEPESAAPLTLAATFPDAASAGQAVAAVRAAGIVPSLFELLDRTVLRAIEDHARMGLGEAGALVIAQSDAGPEAPTQLARISDACASAGALDVAVAEDQIESDQLVQARRLAYPALEALGSPLVETSPCPSPHSPRQSTTSRPSRRPTV
jgi:glycolate oxidase